MLCFKSSTYITFPTLTFSFKKIELLPFMTAGVSFPNETFFHFLRHSMSEVFLFHLSCVWRIHCRCTTDFLVFLHTRIYHIFLFEILSFSISWDLKVFPPFDMFAKICSCIQILHDQSCYRLSILLHFQEEKGYYRNFS